MIRALVLAAALAVGPAALIAQEISEQRVTFDPGTSGATVAGQIEGYEIVDYLLGAQAGQTMSVALATDNLANYFNVLFEDDPEALFIGSIEGTAYTGVLPESGDYRIRVFLMRSAARREEVATYTLDIAIGGEAAVAEPAPDFADGLAGGPDRWEVAGVGGGDSLNIRRGPSTGDSVVTRVVNGDILTANGACVMTGETRWCPVLTATGVDGWASGDFLREASGQPEVTGQLPCATSVGQPMNSCAFRAVRGPGGAASIWITTFQGPERYLEFRDGEPVATDPGLSLTFQRIPEITLIQVGEAERYEIPDAIVFGG